MARLHRHRLTAPRAVGGFGPRAALACALLGATSAPAAAQASYGWELGAAGTAGLLVGGASDFLDGGYGVGLSLARGVIGPLGLRADFVRLGLDADEDPAAGEVADNTLIALLAGPQVVVGAPGFGLALRGYVGAAAASQRREGTTAPETTTWARALGAGAALRVGLPGPLAVELGGDLISTGELDFARTAAAGGVTAQDVVVLALRLGVVLRLP